MKRLLLCIATVAAFAFMTDVALGGKTYSAEAFIQNGNGSCGTNEPQDPVIGIVTFHRTGNVIRFAVDVEHGAHNAPYGVSLWENSPIYCELIYGADQLTTNNRGEGHYTGELKVEEDQTTFFADVSGPAGGGETRTVALP